LNVGSSIGSHPLLNKVEASVTDKVKRVCRSNSRGSFFMQKEKDSNENAISFFP
jgi:hypothetical protein